LVAVWIMSVKNTENTENKKTQKTQKMKKDDSEKVEIKSKKDDEPIILGPDVSYDPVESPEGDHGASAVKPDDLDGMTNEYEPPVENDYEESDENMPPPPPPVDSPTLGF